MSHFTSEVGDGVVSHAAVFENQLIFMCITWDCIPARTQYCVAHLPHLIQFVPIIPMHNKSRKDVYKTKSPIHKSIYSQFNFYYNAINPHTATYEMPISKSD